MVKKKQPKSYLLILVVLIATFILVSKNIASWIENYCDWQVNQLSEEVRLELVEAKDFPDDWELKDTATWTTRGHFEKIKCETNPFFWHP